MRGSWWPTPPMLAMIACTLLAVACAGSTGGSAGSTTELHLLLARADGEALPLANLRGKPALLFLFATFDDASQLALTPLVDLHRRRPQLRIIGIALQPDPQVLLQTYAVALDIDFELTHEPQGRLLRGETPLGDHVVVPMFVALDAAGRVVSVYTGVPSRDDLDALLDALPPH
jgi:hypothetical protein